MPLIGGIFVCNPDIASGHAINDVNVTIWLILNVV